MNKINADSEQPHFVLRPLREGQAAVGPATRVCGWVASNVLFAYDHNLEDALHCHSRVQGLGSFQFLAILISLSGHPLLSLFPNVVTFLCDVFILCLETELVYKIRIG